MTENIGLVGCGTVAQMRYVAPINSWKNITGKLVYDIIPENASFMANAINAKVSGLDELIEKSDAIIITSPPHTHFDLLQKSALKGKTVICEKPFLFDAQEVEAIAKQAEQTGAKVYVAHMRRTFPSTRLVRNLLKMNVFGKIKSISIHEGGHFGYKTKSSYETKSPYGGVLLDTGSHALDQLLFVCGLDNNPIEIKVAQVERNKPEPSHDFSAAFSIVAHTADIPVKCRFSRRESLSGTMKIILEGGEIIMPLGMDNGIRIRRGETSTLIHSPEILSDFGEAFFIEYDNILFKDLGEDFEAKKFMNLTYLLETLLNFK